MSISQVGGKDMLVHLPILRSATDNIVVGSTVASVWGHHPATLKGGGAQVAEAYPDRLVLGLGASFPRMAESVSQS